MKKFKHKITGIIGELLEDGHLHFDRCGDKSCCHETIWKGFIENSNDWEEIIEEKPVLITEYGKKIYRGDELWFVMNNFEISEKPSVDNPFVPMKFKWEYNPTTSQNYHWFSNKVDAEHYILMNKPVLSLNDINNSWSFTTNREGKFVHGLNTLCKLRELVRQRL